VNYEQRLSTPVVGIVVLILVVSHAVVFFGGFTIGAWF
jgi:hypothetical protein